MSPNSGPLIVWFRRDLRLRDNPALYWACKSGHPILPIFIWAPQEETPWEPGAASKWWLHHSLSTLNADLDSMGLNLVIAKGATLETLQRVIRKTGAVGVYWNRLYDPATLQRDTLVKSSLKAEGIEVKSFNGSLLYEPWEIETKEGKPYQVFTPFWNAVRMELDPAEPLPKPRKKMTERPQYPSLQIEDLGLLPNIDWAGGMESAWVPGEAGARKELEKFQEIGLENYPEGRDYPAKGGTSRMSPYLHFGEISPRVIWHKLLEGAPADVLKKRGHATGEYLRELAWREFAHHLLYHFPHTPDRNLREKFDRFPWRQNSPQLKRWQRGKTGYPIVDAGMRELWTTGYMHNRVRMIVASFLVKDLRIHWVEGAKWFWDTLVDADLANNTMGWQWTSGCGADAAPFFRIFNPVKQGEKFDPRGDYVRKWVPEIAGLEDKFIHSPWLAPSTKLKKAGITLDETYPGPIVDHSEQRESALEAFKLLQNEK